MYDQGPLHNLMAQDAAVHFNLSGVGEGGVICKADPTPPYASACHSNTGLLDYYFYHAGVVTHNWLHNVAGLVYNARSFGHWGVLGACCDGACCKPLYHGIYWPVNEEAATRKSIDEDLAAGRTKPNLRLNCGLCYIPGQDVVYHLLDPPPMRVVMPQDARVTQRCVSKVAPEGGAAVLSCCQTGFTRVVAVFYGVPDDQERFLPGRARSVDTAPVRYSASACPDAAAVAASTQAVAAAVAAACLNRTECTIPASSPPGAPDPCPFQPKKLWVVLEEPRGEVGPSQRAGATVCGARHPGCLLTSEHFHDNEYRPV